MFNWRDDICTCASQECPLRDKCVRATQYHKPGIHTVSDFNQFCKDNNNEYFIEEDE